MRYNEDYTKADAEADAESDRKDAMEKWLVENDSTYAWKRRVVDAVRRKAVAIRWCHREMGITDDTEVILMLRRIKHLEKWLDAMIEEGLSEAADHALEMRDPYAYRGLRRSDFI